MTLTLFQGAYHASQPAQPEKERVRKMIDGSGRRLLESLECFNRLGSFSRMFVASLVLSPAWYSTRCLLTWKLKATKSSRFYFQLAPSMLPTEGTGFGLLLKTPTAIDATISGGKPNPVSGDSGSLAQEIQNGYAYKRGLLPTPRACEAIERRNMKTVIDKVENGGDVTLTTMAKYGGLLPTPQAIDGNGTGRELRLKKGLQSEPLLPTPAASDNRDRGGPKDPAIARRLEIGKQVGLTMMVDGQLNPRFVAEMMGFPPNWTELPFLATEKNQ